MKCPTCGTQLRIVAESTYGRDLVNGRVFHSAPPGQAPPASDFAEYRREVTSQAPTLENQVWIPALWSSISAAIVGIAVVPITAAFEWPGWVPPTIGGVTFALTWFGRSVDMRGLLRTVEEIINHDLDGDGDIGDPDPPAKHTIRVELENHGRLHKIFDNDEFNISDEELLAFARGIVQTWDFTEGRWGKDRVAFPEGVNTYRRFRNKLEDRGWIVKESGASNAKRVPTAAGRSLFRRLAALPH